MRTPLLAILVTVFAASVFADEPLAGSWTIDRPRSDDIDKAVNETVRKINVFTRRIARGRLRKTNPAYSNIEISFSEGDARITAGPSRVVLPLSGAPVKWKRDGETLTVTGKMQNGTYVETFDAKDGRRTNVFSVIPDGQLTMSVTVTAPRLPAPLRYKLVYRRS